MIDVESALACHIRYKCRSLVITAEIRKLLEAEEPGFRHAMWELALLMVMVIGLVAKAVEANKQHDG